MGVNAVLDGGIRAGREKIFEISAHDEEVGSSFTLILTSCTYTPGEGPPCEDYFPC